MNILAISGSLRAASINSALLRAIARLAPPDIHVELYQGLGNLPLFNPDIEAAEPTAVVDFRSKIITADAVLIASPEYAHGVTGVLKNALDWMVGNESFVNKPIALLNASPVSIHASASLKEIVTVMSARVVEDASITVPLRGARLNEQGIYSDPAISAALRDALQTLKTAVERIKAEVGE
jgi:chromate reductase, NAD(P)H dehydrogenase (quinone)